MNDIKTIDIEGVKWHQRSVGNTYCAAKITINFGLKSERHYTLPMTYGYGDYYVQGSIQLLRTKGELSNDSNTTNIREAGIILRHNVKDVKYSEIKKYK